MIPDPSLVKIFSIIIIILFSIGYILLLYRMVEGWHYTKEWKFEDHYIPKTKVSIIIAARNEEKSIGNCIESIQECNYPQDLFEIIVINDHSEDNTENIVRNFQSSKIRLINLNEAIGKKNALEKGINMATGSLIACTDADCVVSKDWLLAFVSFYEMYNAKCIAGPISYYYDQSILQRFQFLDALNNLCVTAYGIKKKSFYMANGANLFFTKSVFKEVGGYRHNSDFASGDDMFLIQQIAKKYPNDVHFLKSKQAIVKTTPETTLAELINQRTRWATKSKYYANNNIMKIQSFVFTFICLILFYPFLGLFGNGLLLIGFFISVSLKLTMDYLYLSKIAAFFNDREALKSFFSASVAFFIYILFAGWKALWPTRYKWKGRETK